MDLTKMEIHTMTVSDLDEIKENLSENFNNFWNYKIFKDELVNNLDVNGIPPEVVNWNHTNYELFLNKRRHNMAQKIKNYYEKI